MGSANSTELLEMPLHAQAKPVRLSERDLVVDAPTTFRIHVPTWRSTLQVVDTKTDQLIYEIKSKALSTRYNLHAARDHSVVMSLKAKPLKSDYRVYEGAETEHERYTIGVKKVYSLRLVKTVIFCEFPDRVSGDACRVIVEGDVNDRVAVVYLERSRTALSPLPKKENTLPAGYQPIGRIHRPKDSDQNTFIEAAAGVDMTVLLLLWLVRHDISVLQQQASTVAPPVVVY